MTGQLGPSLLVMTSSNELQVRQLDGAPDTLANELFRHTET
jgi:hypothetical protein